MNDNTELKPCPFCGRNVTIKKRCVKDWTYEYKYCPQCGRRIME